MVGDRSYDVAGAAACGIPCIGVFYGYGEAGELESAGAAAVCKSCEELCGVILSGASKCKHTYKSHIRKKSGVAFLSHYLHFCGLCAVLCASHHCAEASQRFFCCGLFCLSASE